MTTAAAVSVADPYTGLKQLERTLPSSHYFDPAHYEGELAGLWYKNWLYVCRSSELPDSLMYRTFTIGSQSIVVVRDDKRELRAFHNTCRHRGSILCSDTQGRLKSKALICPYHNWSYNLQGQLVGVPRAETTSDFDRGNFALYDVALREWNGFIFINLSATPSSFEESLKPDSHEHDKWPMASLVSGHVMRTTLACNWKIFWENFSECYHCPNIHPELSALVPIYGRRMMGQYDAPDWESHKNDVDPKYRGGLRSGAKTWSLDGQLQGQAFDAANNVDGFAGHRYITSLPSFFVVAHADYVRSVAIRPVAPEQTEITAEWLFAPETLNHPSFDLEKAIGLGRLVIEQDGQACELNQRGIRSIAHKEGVLMPQEYAVHRFQQWVRSAMSQM